MGYSQGSAFAVVALILFAAANPLTHAQILPQTPLLPPVQLPPLNSIIVVGNLTCPTGPGLPAGPGIPGVTVSLNCTNLVGATVGLGQAVTGVSGFFNITATNILQTVTGGGLVSCRVVARLPLQQTVCPILTDATGILAAATTLVGTALSSIFGLVGFLTANGPFVIIST